MLRFLLVYSIVELTVGVMCGCMPAFAAFLRYHQIPLNSLLRVLLSSFRKSSLKSMSGRGSSRKLATRDLRMTLGSRVDGRGHFLNPTSVFADEGHWTELGEAKTPGHVTKERQDLAGGGPSPETSLPEHDSLQRSWHTFRYGNHGEMQTHIRNSYTPETNAERIQSTPGIRVESEMHTVWS